MKISAPRTTCAILAAFTLSGCLGSGGGGGGAAGPGGGGSGNFAAELSRVQNLGPTSNMPTSINAAYTGQAQVDLFDATSTSSTPIGQATADLDLSLNWTDGGPGSNVWSGTADNLTGNVNGTAFTSTGAIGVDGPTSSAGRTVSNPVPGVTVATGAMMVNLAGTMDIDDGTGPQTKVVAMNLGGSFFGNNGIAASGPAQISIFDSAGPLRVPGDVTGAGQFYIEQ